MSSYPSVTDWLETFHNTQAKVWVEDPESMTEKIAFMTKQYLSYRILLKYSGRDIVGIRHRFSEFEAMRNELKTRYSLLGITVPGLPPKRILNDDPGFIKERTHALTLFCQDIVASPWLRNDKEWIDFMRAPSDGKSTANNMGESMLMLSYAQLEPPANPYQRLCEFKDELLLVERQIQLMVTAATSVQTAAASLEKANGSMHQALMEWADMERSVPKVSGAVYNSSTEDLLSDSSKPCDSVAAYSNMMVAKNNANADMSMHTGVLLIASLQHELSRIDAFREVFKAHDELSQMIDSLALKEQKMRSSKDPKRDALAELSRQVLEKRNILQMFYKGLLHYSIPCAVRARAIAIRNCLSMMAAMHTVNANENRNASYKFFLDINASPIAAASKASNMLDLLQLKQIRFPEEASQASMPLPQLVDEMSVKPHPPVPTALMFEEAVRKNSKGVAVGSDAVAPAAVKNSPPPPRSESPKSSQRPASHSPTPSAAAAPPAPPVVAAPVPAGNRGSAPGLLGRRREITPPPAAVTNAASASAAASAIMSEEADEPSASPSPPAAAASAYEPEPAKPAPVKPQTAKTKSLLDDLMGGGGGDDAKKANKDDLWG